MKATLAVTAKPRALIHPLTKSNLYVTLSDMNVQEYIKEDGSSPFQQWFDSLDAIAAAKVAVAKSRLALGNAKRGNNHDFDQRRK